MYPSIGFLRRQNGSVSCSEMPWQPCGLAFSKMSILFIFICPAKCVGLCQSFLSEISWTLHSAHVEETEPRSVMRMFLPPPPPPFPLPPLPMLFSHPSDYLAILAKHLKDQRHIMLRRHHTRKNELVWGSLTQAHDCISNGIEKPMSVSVAQSHDVMFSGGDQIRSSTRKQKKTPHHHENQGKQKNMTKMHNVGGCLVHDITGDVIIRTEREWALETQNQITSNQRKQKMLSWKKKNTPQLSSFTTRICCNHGDTTQHLHVTKKNVE